MHFSLIEKSRCHWPENPALNQVTWVTAGSSPGIERLWSVWNRGGKMDRLKNIRHERFAQNVVSGLSFAAAYVAVGYKKAGANANAARLMRDDSVSSRVAELRNDLSATTLQLQITEREQRLLALQDRWDRLRQAADARAVGDYSAMMRTGIVVRKFRTIGSGRDAQIIEEYEIDTALVEALNSVERRAAIETGHEQENVNLTGQISAKSIALSKVMTLPELEAIEAKMRALMEAERTGKVIDAPLDENDRGKPRANAASEEPGKLRSAAPTTTQTAVADKPETGAAQDGDMPSDPEALRSWRD
jgi:hypothetical protein